MISLQDLLNNSSHRHLELMAHAHKIPFTRREPKAIGLAKLEHALQSGIYQKTFQKLETAHIEALQALVIGGGYLPLPLFEAHFGEIRPYRPWRKHFYPRHPWRYPASVAERLFQCGFITIHDKEMVRIISDVVDMLPPLPQAEAQKSDTIAYTSPDKMDLLRDMSAMMGILMQNQSKPVHGRWFALSLMQQINSTLTIKEPGLSEDDGDKIRSELQSGRLRCLHYLAQVSGLISIQNGIFTPTSFAWRWLSSPADFQWDSLMQAVEQDLDSKYPLWHQFRFPDIQMTTFQTIRHTLDDLEPQKSYRVKDILAMLKPYLLPDSAYEIASLLKGIFAWSGVLVLRRGRIFVHKQSAPSGRNGMLSVRENTSGEIQSISLALPDTPSIALTTLLSFAEMEGKRAIISPESIREAYRQGLDSSTIINYLQNITGEAIPRAIQTPIANWLKSAGQLRLKKTTILESDDPAVIDAIREDWRLAKHIKRRLSPTQLEIEAGEDHKMQQKLERRAIPFTSFVAPQETKRITEEINPDMAEYLLLAVRTYQKLQGRLGASIPIPKALTHWLSAQIDETNTIDVQADELVQAVQKRIPQTYPIADDSQQDSIHIRRSIYAAHQSGTPITIDYHSPYLDETSTRTIDILAFSESADLVYIEAYCHLVKDKRTFRLDRIQRVHPSQVESRAG